MPVVYALSPVFPPLPLSLLFTVFFRSLSFPPPPSFSPDSPFPRSCSLASKEVIGLRISVCRRGMNALIQCWFCHQINLIPSPEQQRPHCLRCSLQLGEERPATTAVGLLPEQAPALLIAPAIVTPENLPAPVAPPPHLNHEYATEGDDATRVAPLQQVWGLTTEFGDFVPLLSDVVIVGRKPVATLGATLQPIPDPTQTLSKTHARLCRDVASDTWSVEDLGSTNGVTIYDETMTQQMTLTPGVATVATSFIVLGTMRVRLQRHSKVATGSA